jgi:flagellar hook-basal body complex protein FliE
LDAIKNISNLQVGTAGAAGVGPAAASPTEGGAAASFKDVLMGNLKEVNQLQQEADQKLEDFVTGKTSNMGEVISASQKASMAFSMLTQIRNKLQDSYDELKNLRV